MRALRILAGLALAASLTACGGSDGGSGSAAPDDASKDDFCEGFNGLFEKVLAQATTGDSSAMITALKDWAGDMEDIGTPSDMPEDARRGFELFVEQAQNLDEDATLADLEKLGEDFSDADQADGEAFSAWTEENCPIDIPGLPSIDPSDLPSIDPSDLPSMDPSDLESMMSDLASEMSDLTASP